MGEIEKFKTVLIVGVGLIGGSIGLALKRKGFKGSLLGVDKKECLDEARTCGAIDEGYTISELSKAAAQADLVFLCTPIIEILNLLRVIGKYVKPNTLITDVGSTKRRIIDVATEFLPDTIDFIGGHPMAGSEYQGISAADPFLFENTIYVLTPTRTVAEDTRKALGELIELIGAKVILLLPKLHDEIAAAVSHLPQMAAVSLMNLVAGKQEESTHFLKMAAGGFRDMTRIASSPFDIWEPILETNSDMILEAIDAYIDELRQTKTILAQGSLRRYFEKSAANRLSIPKDTKGFLKPHYDISVSVEDRPGMIAKIADACAEKNVNIKDIEVLKIRENEGGTIRLAFSTEEERFLALSTLQKRGLECRKRE